MRLLKVTLTPRVDASVDQHMQACHMPAVTACAAKFCNMVQMSQLQQSAKSSQHLLLSPLKQQYAAASCSVIVQTSSWCAPASALTCAMESISCCLSRFTDSSSIASSWSMDMGSSPNPRGVSYVPPSCPALGGVLPMDVRPADCTGLSDLLGCVAEGAAVLRAVLISSPSSSLPKSSGEVCCYGQRTRACQWQSSGLMAFLAGVRANSCFGGSSSS